MTATQAPPSFDKPCAQQVTRLRTALLNCVTPEDIVTIAQAMIKKAAEGSLGAARFVFSYVLGKPGTREAEESAVMKPEQSAVGTKPLTREQEKSVEAMYQALYGENPPSPNGDKRKGKDARQPSPGGQFPPPTHEQRIVGPVS